MKLPCVPVYLLKGATAYEWQIGPIYGRLRYPMFWLWSLSRHRALKDKKFRRLWAMPPRAWLFAWPMSVEYDRDYKRNWEETNSP